MTINAAQLLSELRNDHRNMAKLLDLLQREIDRIGHLDDSADVQLICDIMRYMTEYSDGTHHPREDIIYAGMRARQPERMQGLEAVEVDHKDIAAFSLRLLNDAEAIIAGNAVARQRVIEDSRQYVDRLRKHMQWEEKELFPCADTMADDLNIDVSHLDATDPLFGAEPDPSFAYLSRIIEPQPGPG